MLWLLCVPAAWIISAFVLDRFGKQSAHKGTVDALIVPGCAVRPDGTASGALRRRTEHAVSLWNNGKAPIIVLTGGVGRFHPSEAQAAADVARSLGVPDGALILEEESTTTAENAALAAKAFEGPEHRAVLIVTDNYHAWRCRRLFSKHFGSAHAIGSTPSARLRVRGALREVVSIMVMFLRH